jgi:uncharacterized membrane protein
MPGLVPWFLLLHVGAAIIAFGPTFAFPLIGAAGGREPQHGNFGLRISAAIQERLVIPAALSMPVTGLLLIWSAGFDFFTAHWVDLAIVLYVILVAISLGVARPVLLRMIALTGGYPGATAATVGPAAGASASAPGGPPPGAAGPPPGAGGPSPGAGGPSPEFLALVKQSQRNGMIQSALIVVIVFLMVVKPTF